MAGCETIPMYPVVMAGGLGKRFWPLSRRKTPKHIIPVFAELPGRSKFLLLQCVERIQPLSGWNTLYVVTTEEQWGDVASLLPDVPQENLLCEPEGKNTAPSIGIASLRIRRRDPEGIMVVLPSDHYIKDEAAFRATLKKAVNVAMGKDTLVLLGVVPTRPETGFGYIELGERCDEFVCKVKGFREKPAAEQAQKLLASGNFLWNAGIFVWKASAILKAIERTMPVFYEGLQRIDKAIGGPYERKTTKEVYASLEPMSIDKGVLEKIGDELKVIKVDFDWTDVGSLDSLSEVFDKDADGNVIKARHVGIKSKGNIIIGGKRLIATVGVQGTIIVETDDSILVCSRSHAQDIKMLVEEIERAGMKDYL